MRIALAGNPNSGKTTMFNTLTGKTEHVGNWAGVTVDKKEGNASEHYSGKDNKITFIDLPGAYSMSPYTNEESITRDFVLKENPDVIVNIIDATNLNRSLFFTTQLLELKIPVVIALNKSDLIRKKNIIIDTDLLSEALKCPVVETISTKSSNNGLFSVIESAKLLHNTKKIEHLTIEGVTNVVPNKELSNEIDKKRFSFVNEIITTVERRKKSSSKQNIQDKIDKIVANKWLGIPIFAAIIWLIFSISQTWLGPWLADSLVAGIDWIYSSVEVLIGESVNPLISSILLDGIIGGVGAVVGFLPLIMVLFFFLAILEDCGYMARVAVVMDRFFKKIGLSGKSIIPMIVGTGCAIPGVMATRTIKSERQRRTTAMLTPFMPCGAKLPIIALFSGVFFSEKSWVGTSMYFLAILVIIVSGLIIRGITGDKSQSYFIMELPEYRVPSIKRAAKSMLQRAKSFIIKAGTVILVCNAIVHILQTFNWQLGIVSEAAPETSILATIASPLALLFIPLGFGLWQFAAAAITGFIAKENVVGTLAVTFSITNFIDIEELALISGSAEIVSIMGIGAVGALSYLVFNLFTPPCFAAIGAMNSEMESRKWLWGAIGFQLGIGYSLAFVVYQLGTLFTTGSFGSGALGGLISVLVMIGIVTFLVIKGNKNATEDSSNKSAA